MSKTKIILLVSGIAGLFVLMFVAVIVVGIIYLAKDLDGVAVSIESPVDVKVGETFEMIVTVKNEREKKHLSLSDIDIGESYLDNFVIISTKPVAKSVMHVPIDSSMSYTFDTRISPGEERTFTFTLRADKAGIFRGEVDVCEGLRFITAMAQTVVSE
jgi:hypothetical protein